MKYFILLITLLQISWVAAQNNYKSGAYTDNNGKIITGFISQENWKENPINISFKLTEDDVPQLIVINQIQNFKIDESDFYIKKEVQVDVEENKSRKRLIYKDVLLKVLLEGKASLYYYGNKQNQNFYYSIDNEPITLLDVKREIGPNSYLIDENKVRQEILNLFSDCSSISEKIVRSLNYSESSLSSVFTYYNKCSNVIQKTYRQENKVDIKFGIIAGYNSTSFDDLDIRELTDTGVLSTASPQDFGSFNGLIYGAEVEFIFSKINVSAYLNVLILPEYTTTQTVTVSSQAVESVFTEFSSKFTTLTIGGRKYFDLSKDFKVFGDIGFSFHLPGDNLLIFREINDFISDRSEYSSFILGAGIQYKFIFIEPRLDFGRKAFENDINSFNILLGAKIL